MHTKISNNIYVKNPSMEFYWWCRDHLILDNPLYVNFKKMGKEDTIRWKNIPAKVNLYSENGLDIIVPFGCFHAIKGFIKKGTYEISFNNNGNVINQNEQITCPLYDYQEEAVQQMLKNKMGVLIGGCGSGKTNCGIEIIHRIGKKALWLTHTVDLLNQTVARMNFLYPNMKVGTITDGKVNIGEHVTVSTVQTMAKLDKDLYKNEFDTIVVDECHKLAGYPTLLKQFYKVVNSIPAQYKFGLTASETRNDTLTPSMYASLGLSSDGQFKPTWKINRSKTKTMTAKHVEIDLDTKMSYKNEFGETIYPFLLEDGTFDFGQLINYLSTNEERNNEIVKHILEYKDRKQIVLCLRKEQCEIIQKKLEENNIKSVLLMGNVGKKKRQKVLNREIEWDVIVATTQLAKEGLDLQELSVLHMASPICNKSDTVQSVGRIERVCENKPQPLALDYVDINLPYCVNRFNKRHGWLRTRH